MRTAVALAYTDHRTDPAAWARELGISREAAELHLASDVIDLHVDSFIWTRIFGYDLTKRHGTGLFRGAFYSQVDFPRILEAGVTGATWIITTNPARSAAGRERTFIKNLARLRAIFEASHEHFQVVRTAAEYDAARAAGKHGAFIGIQGGNALDREPDALDSIADDLVLRITLVHLSSSTLGTTSSPLRGGSDYGLTSRGRDYVRRLNDKKIFVDLAHVSKRGFWDAVEVHDKSQPLLVTHTGISGVHEHWRNLDDDQLRAVADSGGTIGIMFQSSFLGDPVFSGRAESIVRHIDHVVRTVGEDHVSIGSDFDGAITPPKDLRTCLELPRLVQHMLDLGYSAERIQKVLGKNFLRVVRALRG
jgi:membrane dipeptidase